MTCKILICKLIIDRHNEVLLGTHDLEGIHTIIFDLPQEDFRDFTDARIEITISEMENDT